jgi:FkbM family methyltransferase
MTPNLIYDIGMNNGDDTAYYLSRGFNVIAVEADPKLAATGAERFANEIKSGQLTILNIGIAAEEGEFPFWICDTHPEWSSFDRTIASRDGCPHHEIRIPCKRFRAVLEEFGVPYYLKVDIEGNDIFCVRDLDRRTLPKFISVEAADLTLLTLLYERGFKRFKCISQINFLPLEEPPAIEQRRYEREKRRRERAQWLYRTKTPLVRAFRVLGGRAWIDRERNRDANSNSRTYGSWIFPMGSSGPFGDELPGRWLSYDEMKVTYEHYLSLFQAKEPSLFWGAAAYSFWTDFHARCD